MLRPVFRWCGSYRTESGLLEKGLSMKEDEDLEDDLVQTLYVVYDLLLVPQDHFVL